jgi:hypothetical protein
MNGDNDLESAIWGDMNELEAAVSSDNVHVVVQVDRHADHWAGDGDWTEARRYYIEHDEDSGAITSTLLENLGEVDMGDPAVLSDFLLWAHENYPSERMALSMWNHGDGWSLQSQNAPPPFISWDMTDNSWISIAEGGLAEGLDPLVSLRGPLDILGFDACSMAAWEVAHALRGRARYMVASETTVGLEGFHYTKILDALASDPELETAALADLFAWSAGEFNEEWTFSVADTDKLDALAAAIDGLAGDVLDAPELQQPFLEHWNSARAADSYWHDYYLDLGDLAAVLASSAEPIFASHGISIGEALQEAIPFNYTRSPYEWTNGLTIYGDLDWEYLEPYASGAGATWSQETRWDELLTELSGEQN